MGSPISRFSKQQKDYMLRRTLNAELLVCKEQVLRSMQLQESDEDKATIKKHFEKQQAIIEECLREI